MSAQAARCPASRPVQYDADFPASPAVTATVRTHLPSLMARQIDGFMKSRSSSMCATTLTTRPFEQSTGPGSATAVQPTLTRASSAPS